MSYMTCDVQYGGKITDDLDREMFKTYGDLWYTESIFSPSYPFNTLITEFEYKIPEVGDH